MGKLYQDEILKVRIDPMIDLYTSVKILLLTFKFQRFLSRWRRYCAFLYTESVCVRVCERQTGVHLCPSVPWLTLDTSGLEQG